MSDICLIKHAVIILIHLVKTLEKIYQNQLSAPALTSPTSRVLPLHRMTMNSVHPPSCCFLLVALQPAGLPLQR